MSVGFISDPLAPPRLLLASELAAAVAWDRTAGLQIRMIGQRYVTSFAAMLDEQDEDVDAGLDFSEPWFVATTPGDSLRVLGGIELPGRAAVHPFAPGAGLYYHYAIGDTVSLVTSARSVDLVEVKVTPTRGDEALVVGSLWVDGATGDVGAMQIRFVGKPLWPTDEHPEGSSWANRILSVSATVEHGLWEGEFWLPYRQELELMVRIPFIGNFALPVVFRSRFGRYDVNTGEPIAWLSPDSLRTRPPADTSGTGEGARITISIGEESEEPREEIVVRAGAANGGWEIIQPPDDSLLAYDGWDEPLEAPASQLTLPSAEELERRARELAPEIAGRRMFAIQYDRLPEMIRYNRVEALGLGLSVRGDIPRRAFWSVGAGVGFGVADLEPKGKLDIRYDAPGSRFEIAGYSELHWAGSSITSDKRAYGNALRAFFLGRDDADYYRASGVALSLARRWGRVAGRIGAAWEDHETVDRNTDVAIPGIWTDSVFQLNPPVDENRYWRGDVGGTLYLGDWTRPTNRAELSLGIELGTDGDSLDYVQPRLGLDGRVDISRIAALAFIARGGWTAGDAPTQREWRIGGLETVRGFTHGTRGGESYWTGRLEAAHRRRAITPVLFADVGWAGPSEDWPGDEAIWSVGAGASFLYGIFRIDLVFPEVEEAWLELYFAGSI